jgi:hypothetical protein
MRYFFLATSALLPLALPQGNAGAAGFGGCFGFLVSRFPRTCPLAIDIPFTVFAACRLAQLQDTL